MIFNIDFAIKTFWITVKAIPVSLKIVLLSFLLAVLPAFGIAFARIRKIKTVTIISKFFVSANRGFPIVLQILIVYSFFPFLLNYLISKTGLKINVYDLNPIIYAYLVFTFQFVVSLSEIFRSALQTVSNGQYEAGLSSGLSAFATYRRIIIPQALVSATPNICNSVVGTLKSTSLAYYMTVKDITGAAMKEASIGCNYFEAYLDVFLVYVLLCSVTQLLFKLLESKLNINRLSGKKSISEKNLVSLFNNFSRRKIYASN